MVKYQCKQCGGKWVESTTHNHAGNPLNPADKTLSKVLINPPE